MGEVSAQTRTFHAEVVLDRLFNIYRSVRRLLLISKKISDKQMEQQVINYYFAHKEIHSYGWCPDAKYKTLAVLYDMLICLICNKQHHNNQPIIKVKVYGITTSLKKKFVYMRYDEETCSFDRLGVLHREKSNENMKILVHDDDVKKSLGKYIKNDLACDIALEIYDDIEINKPSTSTDDSNETAMLDSMFPTKLMEVEKNSSSKSFTYKRQLDTISLSSNNDMPLPLMISDEDQASNKRLKVGENVSDPMSAYHETDSGMMVKNEIIQDGQNETANLLTDSKVEDETEAVKKIQDNGRSNYYTEQLS